MGILVEWDNETQTVLRQTLEPDWTLDDFHLMIDTSSKMIRSVDHVVDILVDLSQSRGNPSKLLSAANTVNRKVPDNQGIVVYAGANSFYKTLVNMVKHLAPKATEHMYFANSIDEAYEIIGERCVARQ